MNHLLHFVEAARSGSFTEAAARLRVSTAAVSRSVARLEQEIEARLFNRTTRRLSLTYDGRIFLEQVTEGLDKLAMAKDVLSGLQARAEGTLKVSLPNAFCKHYMMPRLPSFLAAHPKLNLEMHVGDYGVDLLAGGFDIAVQYGKPPETGYILRALGVMRVVLMASPAYLARRGTPRTVSDLAGHDCIGMRNASGSAAFVWDLSSGKDGGKSIKFEPGGRCFVNSQLDTAIYAALHGAGITPCDVVAAQRYLEDGSLQIVLPDYEVADGGELFMLYAHRKFLPVKVRAFADFLVEVAKLGLRDPAFNPYRYTAEGVSANR